jgi:hypothetical protein
MNPSDHTRCYVVIPEGLAVDGEGRYFASDYYMAALDIVIACCKPGDRVYLAPANNFGADQPEDYFGRHYLRERGCAGELVVIDGQIERRGYLDTLDNAVVLRRHLRQRGEWPLGEIILVCNRPHVARGWLMFRLCGYRIGEMKGSWPSVRTGRKMVKRLWFYDRPWVQPFYELLAIGYDCFRFLFFFQI